MPPRPFLISFGMLPAYEDSNLEHCHELVLSAPCSFHRNAKKAHRFFCCGDVSSVAEHVLAIFFSVSLDCCFPELLDVHFCVLCPKVLQFLLHDLAHVRRKALGSCTLVNASRLCLSTLLFLALIPVPYP